MDGVRSFDNLRALDVYEAYDAKNLGRIVREIQSGKIKVKDLDKESQTPFEAVLARRTLLRIQCEEAHVRDSFVDDLPFHDYDYRELIGACCENAIGYIPVPIGLAGHILVDGHKVFLPMATTEGALIASVSRGCKAINLSGGATTALTEDFMTRAPCLRFPCLARANEAKHWMNSPEGMTVLQQAFAESSIHCKLLCISVTVVANYLYPRFMADTGDAMGMNMITKAVRHAVSAMQASRFPDLELVSLSGNLCSDKKATGINWTQGRGKNVVAQCRLSPTTLQDTLKTDVSTLIALNTMKNHVGSAIAGSLGGFNAQSSNVVSALFLATGQDVAQNVESCQCITTMDRVDNDLVMSVTMPSIEVGTIGGGTNLKPQASVLDLLGVRGPDQRSPGRNSQGLARIIAAAVLAGELSLCAALTSDDLVQSHMKLNRKGHSDG